MPWWGWVLLIVAGIVFFGYRAAKSWRASVRQDFLEYVGRAAPEVEILAERDREIDVRVGDGTEGTLRLDRLFAEIGEISEDDSVARESVFEHFLKTLREGGNSAPLDPERDKDRVRPRIVTDQFVQALASEAQQEPPSVATGVPGLSIVFVLDSESSVSYLMDDRLAELGLQVDELLPLAKENLARDLDKATFREALKGDSLNVIKSGDTYDAARLLLVPESLNEGEELAALIPDRDTLVLTAVPDDWGALRGLAKSAAGDPLWDQPLRVSRDGIAAVD